jgi:hypothetical protein
VFEVWQEQFTLSFTTGTKDREVHVAMSNVLDITNAGLDLYTTLDVRTLFAPLFDVRLRLPAEWTITAATVGRISNPSEPGGEAGRVGNPSHVPAQWQIVPLEAGVNEIRIGLEPHLGVGESRQLSLVAHRDLENWPVEQTPQRFPLPEVRLPQAGVVEALYGIAADDDLDVSPAELTGLDPARRDDVQLLNARLQPLGKSLRLGFTYQDTTFTGQLEVSRKPSRVSAATVTFFRIDPETLSSHIEARLRIEGGGVRQLQVAVSESAGTDLRFDLIRPVVGRTDFQSVSGGDTRTDW